MNAHTTIRVDESGRERAHRRLIAIHRPTSDETEMSTRVALAAMRDQATAWSMRATDSAAIILGEVTRLATYAVFADLPTSRLIRIHAALTLTVEAARAVDRIERDE